MCLWKDDPVEILDVPEDQPIVAYKYLKKTYPPASDVFYSPVRQTTIWRLGKKVSSRTHDPLMTSRGRTKIGIFCFATKRGALFALGESKDYNVVIVKVHVWGKVAVQNGERYVKWFGHKYKQPNYRSGRFKGYRAQHAKIVKVY